MGKVPFTEKDIEFIKDYWPLNKSEWIAKAMGRSVSYINQKAEKLGLKKVHLNSSYANRDKE